MRQLNRDYVGDGPEVVIPDTNAISVIYEAAADDILITMRERGGEEVGIYFPRRFAELVIEAIRKAAQE